MATAQEEERNETRQNNTRPIMETNKHKRQKMKQTLGL